MSSVDKIKLNLKTHKVYQGQISVENYILIMRNLVIESLCKGIL